MRLNIKVTERAKIVTGKRRRPSDVRLLPASLAIGLAIVPVFALSVASSPARWNATGAARLQQSPAASTAPAQQQTTTNDPRVIGERAIANQHRDDAALDTYEWIQHDVQTSGGAQPKILDDKTSRIVPTGTGNLHLLLREGGSPVSAAGYRQALETWAKTLETAVNPNDPRIQGALEKERERNGERGKLVDSARQAYITQWLGAEMQDGFLCDKLQLDPNPSFQPRNTAGEILIRTRVTLWIDQKSGQIVRGNADIIHDVGFGGGLFGKIYRGSHFLLRQYPVAPEVWLPSYYQYDLTGRKLMFGFEYHKKEQFTRYRNLGTVRQALAVARADIARSGSFAGDP
jgi:hypothetical protein